jgi:hypothetical protein
MNWFRITLAALVAGLSVAAPLTVTPQADANPPHRPPVHAHNPPHRPPVHVHNPVHPPHAHVYCVYYRRGASQPWICYGSYSQAVQAQQAITTLQQGGCDAFYRGQ